MRTIILWTFISLAKSDADGEHTVFKIDVLCASVSEEMLELKDVRWDHSAVDDEEKLKVHNVDLSLLSQMTGIRMKRSLWGFLISIPA